MKLIRASRLALLLTMATLVLAPSPARAQSYQGLSLREAIQVLEGKGLSVMYSSALVAPGMRVETEPAATEVEAILAEIVAPFGLTVLQGPNGALLIVREHQEETEAINSPVEKPWIEETVISASRYQFLREPGPPAASFTAADLEVLPTLGEDPLRAVARLPGTATGGFTAKSNFRGGETNETLVRFDDLRLYEPYHLKDFQSLFSAINQALTEEVSVYTGGFPARYGARMSSVIDIDPLTANQGLHGEVSLSFFNASGLVGGTFNDGDGDWLISARRGNLDLIFDVIKTDLGEPKYSDAYARLGHKVTDSLRVTGNFLVFDDEILLYDSDQEEEARANYRDKYFWLRFDHELSDQLVGHSLLAHTDITHERNGNYDKKGVGRGAVFQDERSFSIDSLQTDWVWYATETTMLRFGGNVVVSEGEYDYQNQAEFDLVFLTPGASLDPNLSLDLHVRPDGNQYGLYASGQFQLLPKLTTELGLRWDRETLTVSGEEQLSPRINLLYQLSKNTELRASWGRFFQPQDINELQIEDGLTEYFAPQRSDHLVLSVQHRFANRLDLRLEAFRKSYHDLRPRFENLLNSLALLPEIMPDRIRIDSDQATALGVEMSLGQSDAGPFSWWLNYTLSSVEDEFSAADIKRSWDQAKAFGAGLGWSNERWDLLFAWTYHTGWPTTNAALVATDPLPIAATGPRNGEKLRDYQTFDLRVARKYGFDRGSLTLFLQVTNAFNRDNPCCTEYELEDKAGQLALELEPADGLPIVPSLGITWRF